MEDQAQAEDLSDPHVWWRRLVDAVIAQQLGWTGEIQKYLRWVERHRSRAVAEQARATLKALARAESWQDVQRWPDWGYRTTAPEGPATKGRKR